MFDRIGDDDGGDLVAILESVFANLYDFDSANKSRNLQRALEVCVAVGNASAVPRDFPLQIF